MKKITRTKFRSYLLFLVVILLSSISLKGQLGINQVGNLEGDSPSFWNKGSEPASSSLEWAKDESFVLSRSLKITKSVTDEAAMWTSDNMVDIWSPKVIRMKRSSWAPI